MNNKVEKLLVVESDDALRDQLVAVLSDAGYRVSTDHLEGIKAVLAFDPDAVVLGRIGLLLGDWGGDCGHAHVECSHHLWHRHLSARD